ncbi:hypothetical protein EIP91_004864 [Steccherinum ochraceum]|uniref:Uncharacterized protein n=1 Tax=Steccherinum ochraceum TaxID=92696 RepID=A0A4R0RUA8_9APHY|nr:hypothetical protein EIP91_004864 [Steccherinum ochraceum]
MLSVIRKTAARAWNSTSQDVLGLGYSGNEENPVLTVNVEELRDYIPNIPWYSLAHACTSTVGPMCSAVRDTVHHDIDSLARLLVDLEVSAVPEPETSCEEPPSVFPSIALDEDADFTEREHSALGHHEAHTSDLSIPTIVVTPCPSQTRDRAGWVPFQDASFGNRLVVPTHPVVNDVFPPQMAKASPVVERWKFVDGHWWAMLPSLEEQMQKGMFSRPMHCRRRKSCSDSRSKYHSPRSRPPSPSRRAPNST